MLEDARDLLTMLLSTRNARVVDPAKWVTELDADDGFASLRGIL